MGGTGVFDLGLDPFDAGLESSDAGLDHADAFGIHLQTTQTLVCQTSIPEAPVIDGIFDEWEDSDVLLVDLAGDAVAAFDITRVHARSRGTIPISSFISMSVPSSTCNPETGSTGQLRLDILVGDARLTVDFRGRRSIETATRTFGSLWQTMSMTTAPTHTSTEFEMQIDLHEIGANFDTMQ